MREVWRFCFTMCQMGIYSSRPCYLTTLTSRLTILLVGILILGFLRSWLWKNMILIMLMRFYKLSRPPLLLQSWLWMWLKNYDHVHEIRFYISTLTSWSHDSLILNLFLTNHIHWKGIWVTFKCNKFEAKDH